MAAASRIGNVRVGISGWRYEPWRGRFYPAELAQRDELAFASRMLSTIEINGSFYSLQSAKSWRASRDATPDDFVFAVKGSRYITHLKRLVDVEVPLANFFASGLLALGAKLGPLLWQFPPIFAFDAERMERFFAQLPRDTAAAAALARRHDARVAEAVVDERHAQPLRHAVEIRHPSFVAPGFVALLRRHRIALVVADTAGRWPLLEDLTTDFVYVRLHGDEELYASGYGAAALDGWAKRIDTWRRGRQVEDARLAAPGSRPPRRAARDVYCYFDNDIKVHAPYDAARLSQRLGVPAAIDGDGRFVTPSELLRRTPRHPRPPATITR